MTFEKFSAGIFEELGFYVYVYCDPKTDTPFYIGKGKGNRCFDHLNILEDSKKSQRISRLIESGFKPKIDILAFGLDEEQALIVEAAAIDLIGIENLDNEQRGHDSKQYGRKTVDDIRVRLSQEEVISFQHNIALIRINKTYDPSFDDLQLYEVTRGIWEIAETKRDKIKLACAVYEGIIREVYEIASWHPAGSTMYTTRSDEGFETTDRYEFVGRIANKAILKAYKGKKVSSTYFPNGFAGSIRYVGPDFPIKDN